MAGYQYAAALFVDYLTQRLGPAQVMVAATKIAPGAWRADTDTVVVASIPAGAHPGNKAFDGTDFLAYRNLIFTCSADCEARAAQLCEQVRELIKTSPAARVCRAAEVIGEPANVSAPTEPGARFQTTFRITLRKHYAFT